jgi:hypothetical protein
MEALCKAAVKRNGWALEYTPDALRTYELYLEAVEQGYDLRYVLYEYRTGELCVFAVIEDGGALQFVPEAVRSAVVCIEAEQQEE